MWSSQFRSEMALLIVPTTAADPREAFVAKPSGGGFLQLANSSYGDHSRMRGLWSGAKESR
jgi:hypothetical protein